MTKTGHLHQGYSINDAQRTKMVYFAENAGSGPDVVKYIDRIQ